MSNEHFLWKLQRDINQFKAFIAWIKRGFKRKRPYVPRYFERDEHGILRWKGRYKR